MKKEDIWKMALDSGLCDPDLSRSDQICTDYGDATDAVEKFVAMVASAEREECADIAESFIHGTDDDERDPNIVAGEIREAIIKRSNAKVRGPEAALSPEAPSRLTGYAEDGK